MTILMTIISSSFCFLPSNIRLLLQRVLKLYLPSCAVAILAGTGGIVHAAEVTWELGLDTRYTDNINMIPGDGLDELSVVPSASLIFESDTPRLYANLEGLVRHYNYTKDTNSNETQYFGDIVLDFHLVPDLISWRIEDHLSNEPIVSDAPDVPDNRQDVNVFFTGPEFTFRMGQRNRIDLVGGVIRTSAEETSEFDSDRNIGRLAYVHSVSNRFDLGLSGEWEDVEFDELVDSPLGIVSGDYDRTDAYATASFRRGSNTLELEAGASDLDYEELPDDDGERIFARFHREVSELAEWELAYRDMFTDASRTVSGQPNLGLGGINVSADVYRLEGLQFTYSGPVSTAAVELTAAAREEKYVQDLEVLETEGAEDRDVNEVSLDINIPVAPRIGWISTISWAEFDYENLLTEGPAPELRKDEEYWLVTGIEYQMRRRLQLRAQVGRHIIDSNNSLTNADENLVTVSLIWLNR
ncbi:MAG: hypothetical protein CL799_01005 [Chromatiales bacterium]|jgi:hypothetical protein|nr:hypothetical protein [Chromatiales bacterium]